MRGNIEVERLETWAKDAGVDLGEKEGGAASIGGQGIAKLAVHPLDEALAGEAEVIAHLAGGVAIVADDKELGHQRTQLVVGYALGGKAEMAEAGQQGHNPWLAELQSRCGLPLGGPAGEDELSQGGIAETAVMRRVLQLKEATIDTLANGSEIGKRQTYSAPFSRRHRRCR
ncbi:MAG: hypothetical protein HY669_00415 [Chloroflexi bacterium]|nr:hypothetical protein [Chloroflexota bacterium]